jgi:hypothetical protein
VPTKAPTAPRITGRHHANRLTVVNDMVAFLLRRFADVGTYAESVEAALNFACAMNDDLWLTLGQRTGHYANGGRPDDDTTATVLTQLEALLPVESDDADPFANLPKF